jgi:aspartate aminotransferase-like enzyme
MYTCAQPINQKITEKRKLRKKWQNTRSSQKKAAFNKAVKELKKLFYEENQQAIQTYSSTLSAMEATDYSLWKATKRLKQTQTPIPLRTTENE